MKRTALVALVVGSLLAACGGVPELPGAASPGASSAATSTSPAAGASPTAASAVASASPAANASLAASASAAPSVAASPAAEAPPRPDAPLTGTVWQWQKSAGGDESTTVGKPQLYTIEFRDDRTIGIRSDCNSAGGTYTLDGQRFRIFVGPQTMVACPNGSLSDKFLAALPAVDSYTLEAGTLELALETDGGVMSFVPAP